MAEQARPDPAAEAALHFGASALQLVGPPAGRDETLAALNRRLASSGHIRGWRDETYRVVAAPGDEPLACIERASARFWGTLTFGAHCNGYVAGPDGRPTHLWIAERALSKATDPGKLDNLVGGGVPWNQSPAEALRREAWEEAGLAAEQLGALSEHGVYTLCSDLPDGLQREHLHIFDLPMPPGLTPVNQDGEVIEFRCMTVNTALGHAAAGDMTTDAAIATLDFALRHHLLPVAEASELATRLGPLSLP